LLAVVMLLGMIPGTMTAFAQEEITIPTIVSVGGIKVNQETTMGGAPSAMIGQPYSAQVVATGGNLTYSAGAGEYMKLPDGLSIDAETGLISGTCTDEIGRYNCLIKATNTAGEASVVIGITVGDSNCVPEIETAAGSLGETYKDSYTQFTVRAANNNASMSIYNFSWSIKSGALPDGMSLAYVTSRTVYLSGTPTATGTFTFELEAKNDCGTASRTYSISVIEGSVRPGIVASGNRLGHGVVGKPFEYQLEATGTNSNEDPMLWSTISNDFSQESYDLGNGLSMSKTGLITGTPLTNEQVDFSVYAKNSGGTDNKSFYISIHDNGEATSSSITPEVAVVAKGSSKEFTISLEGYGDVEQVAYWSFYMWDDELGSAFPRPTDSTLSVDTSTPSKTVTLTVGENETRGQIRVVAYSKPGNGGVKTWATVTIVEKAAVIYNVSFDKDGGTGEMASVPVVENGTYKLPACGFTAPDGKQFKAWSVGGVEKAAGDTITVNANTTVTAIWENIPVIADAEFTGASLSLGADLSLNYYVKHNNAEDLPLANMAVQFTINERTSLVKNYTIVDGEYVFSLKGIAPQEAADYITASVVELNGDGSIKRVVKTKAEYRVIDNIESLAQEYKTDSAMVTLLNSIVWYSERAQAYLNYYENGSVRSNLQSNTIDILGNEPTYSPEASDNIFALDNELASGSRFTAAGVRFSSDNKLYVKVNAAETVTLVVKKAGAVVDTVTLDAGVHTYYTKGIFATEFDVTYTFELTIGESATPAQTLTYSVNSYAIRTATKTESGAPSKMANLARALYNYGKACEAFIAAS